MSKPKLLLIDANNMAHRVFWAQRKRRPDGSGSSALSHKGKEVDMLFGFFRQLVHLHKMFPEHLRLIVWDRTSTRRMDESRAGVEAGIVPSAYKENRKRDPDDPDYISFSEQADELRDALEMIRCLQVRIKDFEADDIIFTYAKEYAARGGESVIISSDKDFYQALSEQTKIYDAMNKVTLTEERFEMESGFPPYLWVDAGALMGDKSDNIFGIDGWGPKTSNQYVSQYGDVDAVVAAVQAKKKRGKKEEVLLAQLPRLKLAKSLKAMDMVPGIPKPRCMPRDPDALKKYFLSWGFVTLLKEVPRLV